MPANEHFVAGVLFDLGRIATRARQTQPAVVFLEASTNIVRAQPRDARVARMLCRVSEALGAVGETQRGEILAKEAVQIYHKEGLKQPAQEAEQLRARLAGERRGGWLGGLVVPDDHARVRGASTARTCSASGRRQWAHAVAERARGDHPGGRRRTRSAVAGRNCLEHIDKFRYMAYTVRMKRSTDTLALEPPRAIGQGCCIPGVGPRLEDDSAARIAALLKAWLTRRAFRSSTSSASTRRGLCCDLGAS
jgi:hypothetical protein